MSNVYKLSYTNTSLDVVSKWVRFCENEQVLLVTQVVSERRGEMTLSTVITLCKVNTSMEMSLYYGKKEIERMPTDEEYLEYIEEVYLDTLIFRTLDDLLHDDLQKEKFLKAMDFFTMKYDSRYPITYSLIVSKKETWDVLKSIISGNTIKYYTQSNKRRAMYTLTPQQNPSKATKRPIVYNLTSHNGFTSVEFTLTDEVSSYVTPLDIIFHPGAYVHEVDF